jgi:predicted DNA-binding transcriptional regulator YafY
MENVKIEEEITDPKSEIDVEGLIFRSEASGQKIVVEVDESAERAFRANLPAKIIKSESSSDKKNKVSFRFDNLGFINDWLLQFGNSVRVLSPKSLIKKRVATLKTMLDEMDR